MTLWLRVLRKSYVSHVGDMNNDISVPAYEYEITQNETKEIELIIAPGTKASYQVTVDDKVVLSESVSYPE